MSSSVIPYFVAIGASGAEGLQDIIDLLTALSKPVPAVIMVVLHRPQDKISHLRQILGRECGMPILIAHNYETFRSGLCYIGEPDGHLTVINKNLARLIPDTNDRLRNRNVDALFNSLALYAGRQVIGVVLSGALDDGSRGLAAIHAAGGITMVLEPGHKPRGMQQNAINYDGPIGFIGRAKEIASRISQIIS